MTQAAGDHALRPLSAADLDRLVAIDTSFTGQARRQFFEKRLLMASSRPDEFVQVGVEAEKQLQGYAIAHILRGEFGQRDAVAVIDALGVDKKVREHGLGRALMEGLVSAARERGARAVQTQVDWKAFELLRYFNASQFEMAPRVALECLIAEVQDDPGEIQ